MALDSFNDLIELFMVTGHCIEKAMNTDMMKFGDRTVMYLSV